MNIFNRIKNWGKSKEREVTEDIEEIDDYEEYREEFEDGRIAIKGEDREDELSEENESGASIEIYNEEDYKEDGEEGNYGDDGKDVVINYGGSGLLNTGRRDKEDIYKDIRAKVTDEEMIAIDKFLQESLTEYDLYKKLEENNISLMVLVALGFVSEEDLSGYRALQRRGIDTENIKEEKEETTELEDDYESEVLSMRNPVEKDTKELEESIEVEEEKILVEGITEDVGVDEFSYEGEEEDSPYSLADLPGVNGGETDEVQEEEEKEEREKEKEEREKEKEVDKKEKKGGNPIEALMRLRNLGSKKEARDKEENRGDKEEENNVEEINETKPEEEIIEPVNEDRKVFIVREGYTIPKIEGYTFYLVETFKDIDRYTASKDNLLVVTSKIPEGIIKDFGKWLNGIVEDKDMYRMVTLKDSPVKHPKIERVIDLTENDLNDYYEEFPSSIYGDTVSGSFLDITTIIQGK